MSGSLGVGVSCGGVIRMVCQCKFVLVGHSRQQDICMTVSLMMRCSAGE